MASSGRGLSLKVECRKICLLLKCERTMMCMFCHSLKWPLSEASINGEKAYFKEMWHNI